MIDHLCLTNSKRRRQISGGEIPKGLYFGLNFANNQPNGWNEVRPMAPAP
jgi:hypothetical protein